MKFEITVSQGRCSSRYLCAVAIFIVDEVSVTKAIVKVEDSAEFKAIPGDPHFSGICVVGELPKHEIK